MRCDKFVHQPHLGFSLYLIAILVLAAVSVLMAGETMHRDIGRFDEQRKACPAGQ